MTSIGPMKPSGPSTLWSPSRGLADELLLVGVLALVVARAETLVLLVAQGAVAVVEGGTRLAVGVLLALRLEQRHHLVDRNRARRL